MPTHDEICKQAVNALESIDQNTIVAAFVGSLSTRNLAARSAFGSYVVLQEFSCHDFTESQTFSMGHCAICGSPRFSERSETDHRVAGYPFQVQHTDIQYAAFDLSSFNSRLVDIPTDNDRELLVAIFTALRSLPTESKLTELNKSLQGVFKSNKHQRMILLETFGYAGILCPTEQRNYTTQFVEYDFANENQPDQFFKREWAYPIRFWSGEVGVNEEMIEHYFSSFL